MSTLTKNQVRLNRYEENLPNDSYWYVSYFDTTTKTFGRILVDTTAFAPGDVKEKDLYGESKHFNDLSQEDQSKLTSDIEEASKKELLSRLSSCNYILDGDEIEVFKGRKFPVGLKTIADKQVVKVFNGAKKYYVRTAEGEIDKDNVKVSQRNPSDKLIRSVTFQLKNYGHIPYNYTFA